MGKIYRLAKAAHQLMMSEHYYEKLPKEVQKCFEEMQVYEQPHKCK